MDAGRPLLVTYLDSSALARLVFGEGDLAMVRQGLLEGPIASELIVVEMRAAIWKRWHDRDMNETERNAFVSLADSLLFSAISMISLSSDILMEASNLVARLPIRTLDALHLATAAAASRNARRHGHTLRFCTADRRQSAAAIEVFGASRVLFVPPWR